MTNDCGVPIEIFNFCAQPELTPLDAGTISASSFVAPRVYSCHGPSTDFCLGLSLVLCLNSIADGQDSQFKPAEGEGDSDTG